MKDKDNIKELFQKELGNYKAKVDPNLWTGIQSSIGGLGAAGTASSIGLVGKIIIGVSIVAAVTVGTVVLVKNNKTTIDKKEKLEVSTHKQVEFQENEITQKNTDLESNQKEIKTNQNKENQVDNHISETKNVELDHSNTPVNNIDEENTSFVDDDPINEKDLNQTFSNHKNGKETTNVVENETSNKSKSYNNSKVEANLSQVEIEVTQQKNQFVRFSAKDVPEGATIEWNFDDGNYSRTQQPEHYFNQAGDYNVELTIRKENKEIRKDVVVSIKIEGEIGQLPNVFTPNGDGQNDIFFIESKHLKSFQLTIMDMNQKVIYTTNNPDFRWKGLDKYGQPVKEGNYIYIIVAEDESGNTINKYQKLTIHR